jgi:Gpi18-like mannosyltransferase
MIKTGHLLTLLLLALVLRLVLSITVYSGDVNNHVEWGRSIMTDGARGAYDREYTGVMQPTYPPLSLYAFTTSYWMYDSLYNLSWAINKSTPVFPSAIIWAMEDQDVRPAFHKVISIISDLGIAVLIYALSRKVFSVSHQAGMSAAAIFLFNPAIFYNSALWGQMESPPIFWVMLSVWLILTKRPIWGHAAFVFALLFKQSTLVFIPLIMLLSLFKAGWKKTFLGLLVQVAVFFIAYLPFIPAFSSFTETLVYPFSIYLDRIEVGSGSNYISDHAFNLWALFTHLEKIPDSMIMFSDISANLLGKVIFIAVSGLFISKYLLSRSTRDLLSLFGLVSLCSFMVLTRMHERYLAPAIPFLALVSASKKQLRPIFYLVSLGHLINLYHEWWFPYVDRLVPIIASWNTILFVILLFTISWISWSAVYFHDPKR